MKPEEIDSLGFLLSRAAHKPLPRAEELQLLRAVQAGDRRAADRLACQYIRLVLMVAKRAAAQGIDLQDLVQEGLIGLVRAAKSFDCSKGTRFST